MQFRILGPLEVLENERALNVGGSKQRGILAVLLLNANQVVPSARLIDALWEDQPPATAQKALQVYVSQLRGKLGKDRLLTKAPGYLLRVAPHELDLGRFEALLAEGRELRPEAASAKLREALSLWRGPPLAEFASQRFAQAGIARLEELRLACLEERIEADLACGRHAELVGELEGLVKEHPFREPLREQLMLAFYRSGRQAEALRAYQDARRMLVEELGIEPGKRLRELEQAVLRQDVSLEPARASEVRAAPAGRAARVSPLSPTAAPVAREVAVSRKTVTVLFADVADSTALGERIDPETLRGALARWFEEARSVIERHGGTVEKYVGDSVMAVFGVPQLHEDDALRAVRAANDLGDALARLNEQLERERGLRFTVRVGINTGEVVTGDGSGTLVTGDAVNVAKRLEEAGDGGDVIVGDATYRLTRNAAQFQRLAPLALKGKSARIRAWRLVEVDRDGLPYERHFETPLVGRRRELDHLRRAFRRSVAERTCHLFTLLGTAGIGKTRLASELFEELAGEALVLTGRCLPYGDGITFWPLHEVIRELGGEENIMRLLAENEDAELVCERLTGEPGSQELFWAVRRLCETLARNRPLVICFEDVHWAEPTFLDLIEYLAGWTRDAPVLLVCIARPEFLDERPAWLSGQENAASLTLSPLSATESKKLVSALGVGGEPAKRIAEAAEGNPLYAEQMAAMVAEGGAVETIPPTIQALLAARLDRLDTDERAVIEAAAVCGKEFWRDAVTALSDVDRRGSIGSLLLSLVRKELIRPHRSTARPDDAFRFGHVLIRDAAYAAVPKETRALLHERFAHWLETESDEAELEEIVGYHLEQAYRNREALGPVDGHATELATRAAKRLASAGRRALARGDAPAAVTLLERAASLLEHEQQERRSLLPDLAAALRSSGALAQAQEVLDEALAHAPESPDRLLEASALVEQALLRTYSRGEVAALGEVAQRVRPVFEELGDDLGVARVLQLLGLERFGRCRYGEAEGLYRDAVAYARRTDGGREESRALRLLAGALLRGPTPVEEALAECREICERTATDLSAQASSCGIAALLDAMRGNFDDARHLYAHAKAVFAELGSRHDAAGLALYGGPIEFLAGDLDAATQELAEAQAMLEELGERGGLSTVQAFLAQVEWARGRRSEAERLAELVEQTASRDDVLVHVVARGTRARALAAKDHASAAESLANEAVALARTGDSPSLLAGALCDLADVQKGAGRSSLETLREAIRLYERKGDVVSAARANETCLTVSA
jgi:class 3 adenylate cyclase/tetratricopeptide (TPR) repeat protein